MKFLDVNTQFAVRIIRFPGSALIFKAAILLRILESSAEGLDIGGFTINLVGRRFKEYRRC